MIYLEILALLATGGSTSKEIAEGLQTNCTAKKVTCYLLEMEREGLVLRVRTKNANRWWPNKQGIARMGAELARRAEILPDASHEDIVALTQTRVLDEDITILMRPALRIEMLKALKSAPSFATELFQQLQSRPSRNEVDFSLRQLEKYGVIDAEWIFSRTPFGVYNTKRYSLTALGLEILSRHADDTTSATEGGSRAIALGSVD